jgi:hypothetical protein
MPRRWTGKTKTNDFHGNHIDFMTVGGRTTAYAPALQPKPKGAGQAAVAKKAVKRSPAPAARADAAHAIGDSAQAQQNDNDHAAPAQKPLAQKLTAAQANKRTRAVGPSPASNKRAQAARMDGSKGGGIGAAAALTRSRTVRALRDASPRAGGNGPVVQETSRMLLPNPADREKHPAAGAVKVAEVRVKGTDGAVVAQATDAEPVETSVDEEAPAVPRRVHGKGASTATDGPGKPQQRQSSKSKRPKRK